MSKSQFRSENFSRVVCQGCGKDTTIEPGHIFNGINCSCNDVNGKDTEISLPLNQELDYVNKTPFTAIGMFKNGDYEVCQNNDLDNTYRVPKETFESDFELVDTPDDTPTITLSIQDLKGMSKEDIAAKYTVDELRVLAKSVKLRGYSNMGEAKLIERLLKKVK